MPMRESRPATFSIRSYRPGDEAAILVLFKRCFGFERSLERWQSIYLANPLGGPWISLAVDAAGELVAHYAGYPVVFERCDEQGHHSLPAVQVGDTMTAPEVRHVGRGPSSLLARTAAHFYGTHCAGRVAFCYGFNTGNIQKFSVRFVGAHVFGPVRYVCAPLPAPAGPRARPHALAGLEARCVERFDERVDALFARVLPAYRYLLRRDRDYLAWRYERAPAAGYRIVLLERGDELLGWSVFRRRDDRLTWGDALVAPEAGHAAGALAAAAIAAEPAGSLERLEGWFTTQPGWWSTALADLGLLEAPEPQDLGLIYVPFLEAEPADGFRSLYYTWGDGDLF